MNLQPEDLPAIRRELNRCFARWEECLEARWKGRDVPVPYHVTFAQDHDALRHAIDVINAGRTGDPRELLQCFKAGGRHKLETLGRRYYGRRTYTWTSRVHQTHLLEMLDALEGQDLVEPVYGSTGKLYRLVSEHVREERQRAREEQQRLYDQRVHDRQTRDRVRARLTELGVSSTEGPGLHQVSISAHDLARLLRVTEVG